MPNFNWPVRQCSSCRRWLALEWAFVRNRSTKDGFAHKCRECHAVHARRYRDEHPDKAAASNRIYRETRKDERAARRADAPVATAGRLRELLTYEPETGLFYDRDGARVATSASKGYLQIRLDGRQYLAHRIAWLYMTGEWPPHEIDHWDLDRGNNRWNNLRSATQILNNANRRVRPNNRLGIKGVSQMPSGRFRACITVDRKVRHLGTFRTAEAACAAYARAAVGAWGEYARVGDDAAL
jgi:hypothetical protein